ncbi:MAG: M28 family peptidase [bacterium]
MNKSPYAHLQHLSVTIGARASGSENERRAAEYVKETLNGLGVKAHIEEFKALPTYSWLYVMIYSFFLVAAVAVKYSPKMALIMWLHGMIFYLTENSTYASLSKILPKRKSCNVIGRIAPDGETRQTIVVTAHIDSSKSAIFFHPAMVKGFRTTFVTTLAAIFAVGVLAAAGFIVRSSVQYYLIIAVALYLVFIILLLVHREIFGRHTHGANDNASGVAAMLETARIVSQSPPPEKEILFVGTGSEETGAFGMTHLLKTQHFDPQRTVFLNLDNLGTGNLSVTTREGMILRRNADTKMVSVAENFTLPSTGKPARKRDFNTMLTDVYPALMRGYRGISIMAYDDEGVLPNWHWASDLMENVSESNLKDAAALAAHIIKSR